MLQPMIISVIFTLMVMCGHCDGESVRTVVVSFSVYCDGQSY